MQSLRVRNVSNLRSRREASDRAPCVIRSAFVHCLSSELWWVCFTSWQTVRISSSSCSTCAQSLCGCNGLHVMIMKQFWQCLPVHAHCPAMVVQRPGRGNWEKNSSSCCCCCRRRHHVVAVVPPDLTMSRIRICFVPRSLGELLSSELASTQLEASDLDSTVRKSEAFRSVTS